MASRIGNMTAIYNPPHPGMLLDDNLGDISLAEPERKPHRSRAATWCGAGDVVAHPSRPLSGERRDGYAVEPLAGH